jgi:hypothetical protein
MNTALLAPDLIHPAQSADFNDPLSLDRNYRHSLFQSSSLHSGEPDNTLIMIESPCRQPD